MKTVYLWTFILTDAWYQDNGAIRNDAAEKFIEVYAADRSEALTKIKSLRFGDRFVKAHYEQKSVQEEIIDDLFVIDEAEDLNLDG